MSSKTDAVVKLAIVFFISLLSFSIGTFVGKKYSDNQHQLAALEPQKHGATSEHRNVASTSDEEHKPGAMTDEDIAKLAEEFVADETTAPQHDGAEKNDETQHHPEATENKAVVSQQHETAEPSSAAKNMAAGKAPAPENTERHAPAARDERIPSSLPKDVAQFAVGKFTIQVAAYADEAEAQKMASSLKNKGYSAFYFPANVRGKTWYRVSVGQFATQKEAQTYKNEFMTKSKMDTAIVQKISE